MNTVQKFTLLFAHVFITYVVFLVIFWPLAALGLHAKLVDEGVPVGSKEYYNVLDKTIRRRFPEQFGDSEDRKSSRGKPSNVVAPASRSTSATKIKLTQSQVNLAKKFGLTPEQYAKAALALENQNGR